MGGLGARWRAVLGLRPAGPRGDWPSSAPDADALAEAFTRRYGVPAGGVWRAPGRVALMGEHTTASGGAALYAALPWGVTAAAGLTSDGGVHAATAHGALRPREPAARAVDEAVGEARRSGLLRADQGLRVLLESDLPAHASLGRTAAVGAAVALALADLAGGPPPEGSTADRRAVLTARPGHAVRVNQRTLRTRVLPFDLAAEGLRLLVVDTGALPRRDPRRVHTAAIEAAQEVLGPLRSVGDLRAALAELPDRRQRDRVEFEGTEAHRLNAAVGLLRAGRAGEVGPILSASHLSLRGFGLPSPDVELAAETASRAGARGVRLSGWAGTVVALAAEERVERIGTALTREFTDRSRVPPRVRAALPSAGAHRLR
ncbi:galactokinase family protein [Nocardiopsis sp. NPDC050513]|uniref:galactokinase family protein n=1 Tax=Nocardiopsis sp. NPDC050513 TaxID=3364338 RepID=UPI0037886DA1